MTWGEWLAIWAGSVVATAFVVAWVYVAVAVCGDVLGAVLGIGIPLALLVGVGGWVVTR